ncbi:MAG: ABC transporter transmembrane domain-containing protein, partial [Anaerolineales bacterium]|nr:ABC transporter transmembrane domain-containing protein [Anaerolineales bacterium]
MMRDGHGSFAGEVSKPKDVGGTLRRFSTYFRPYWPQYLVVLLLMVIGTWTQVTVPRLMGQAVDCYFTPAAVSSAFSQVPEPLRQAMASTAGPLSAPASSNCWYDPPQAGWTSADYLAGLGRLTLQLIAIFVLGSLAMGAMFYLMSWSGQRVLKTLRVDVFKQIMRLSIGYHVQHEAGDTMSRVTNDADSIQQAISFALVQVVSGAFLITWIGYSMFKQSAPYALVALAILPFMVLATVWISSQARR